MITREQYLKAVETINTYRNQLEIELKNVINIEIVDESTTINELPISVRLYNCIMRYLYGKVDREFIGNIKLIDLNKLIEQYPISGTRDVGQKSIQELNKMFFSAGLKPIA